jgi:hypothetical protein
MRQLQLPQVTLQRQLCPPSPQAACHTCLGVLPAHLDWLHAASFMFFLLESLPPALQNCLRRSLPALKCPIHQRLFSSSWPLARFLNPGFSAIIYLWCLTLAPHAVKVRRNVKMARSSFKIRNSRSFALGICEKLALELVRQDPKHVRRYVRIKPQILIFGPRGVRSCRNLTLRTELTADPPGLQYQGSGTSQNFGVQNGGFKGVGGGVVFLTDQFFPCRVLLTCQND